MVLKGGLRDVNKPSSSHLTAMQNWLSTALQGRDGRTHVGVQTHLKERAFTCFKFIDATMACGR